MCSRRTQLLLSLFFFLFLLQLKTFNFQIVLFNRNVLVRPLPFFHFFLSGNTLMCLKDWTIRLDCVGNYLFITP